MASRPVIEEFVHHQLRDRRERLEAAIRGGGDRARFEGLLREVDAALQRFDAGSYGLCEGCHESIEQERLTANPLLTFCLDCLTDAERHHLQMDLERASLIQSGLLPPRDLAVPGWEVRFHYEPAGPVSGDFYDVIALDADHVGLVIGDVSGKGMPAALYMALTRSLLLAQVRRETSAGLFEARPRH